MKNGGKNKSVAIIILFSVYTHLYIHTICVCVYIYIYIYMCVCVCVCINKYIYFLPPSCFLLCFAYLSLDSAQTNFYITQR